MKYSTLLAVQIDYPGWLYFLDDLDLSFYATQKKFGTQNKISTQTKTKTKTKNKTKQRKEKKNKTKQNKTKQNKTKQKQNKTKQKNQKIDRLYSFYCLWISRLIEPNIWRILFNLH